MTSTNVAAAVNRLPHAASVYVLYAGDLAASKWVSLVDSSFNANDPCTTASTAASGPTAVASGAVQATTNTKSIRISANDPTGLNLDPSKSFAVCYAETDGSTTDSTWRDSYIRLQISKIQSISSHLVTHTTTGQIASVSSLELTYAGSLGNN
jgi:hypothetical protein